MIFRVNWKKNPIETSSGACIVNWKNYLIVFGGIRAQKAVQRYNIVSGKLIKIFIKRSKKYSIYPVGSLLKLQKISVLETWEVMTEMSKEQAHAGCTLIPNTDDILVVGSWNLDAT